MSIIQQSAERHVEWIITLNALCSIHGSVFHINNKIFIKKIVCYSHLELLNVRIKIMGFRNKLGGLIPEFHHFLQDLGKFLNLPVSQFPCL